MISNSIFINRQGYQYAQLARLNFNDKHKSLSNIENWADLMKYCSN